jgi:AraC family transcriptional regulator
MQPEIKTVEEKKLIGFALTMSLTDNKTAELWRMFMPRRKEISNSTGSDLISLQIYPENYYEQFNPGNTFVKWASCEVTDFNNVPNGMQSLSLSSGLYAIFHYKGSSADASIYQYIFNEWLPQSKYKLDNRPHFEMLGEKYRNIDPSSEELICIPVLEA